MKDVYNTADLFETGLKELEEKHLTRILSPLEKKSGKLVDLEKRELLDFASNDYLNLANNPEVVDAASKALKILGASSSASRLVTGTSHKHVELEQGLAHWTRREEALIFGTGYQTNTGTIQALVGRHDSIFIDKYAHASLVDGSLLSRANIFRFKHNDMAHLKKLLETQSKKRRAAEKFIVITESIFSMDGDSPDFNDLVALSAKYESLLLVDEAHSFGITGDCGSGSMSAIDKHKDLTLSLIHI